MEKAVFPMDASGTRLGSVSPGLLVLSVTARESTVDIKLGMEEQE